MSLQIWKSSPKHGWTSLVLKEREYRFRVRRRNISHVSRASYCVFTGWFKEIGIQFFVWSILCTIDSVYILVTFVMQLLQTSRWFRRRRTVGVDGPLARSNPTARCRRNHLEVCKSCMTKVTRLFTLSMGHRRQKYWTWVRPWRAVVLAHRF